MHSDLEFRLLLAHQFMLSLPDGTAEPGMCLDNDGDICLDWHAAKGATIAVCVGPVKLNWAWMMDDKSGHGCGKLTELPPEVLRVIAEISGRMKRMAVGQGSENE